jgi:ParB-like chromosome segregation protein Spo0J
MFDDFHPHANFFPLLDGEDFDALADDVKLHGVRQPIWRHRDGRIIDGRNRYRAAQAAGVACPFQTFDGSDEEILDFVVSQNIHRRHLSTGQRALIAATMATMRQGARTDLSPIGDKSQADAAQLMGVAKRSVERAATVLASKNLTLIRAVREGELAVSTAAEIARMVLPDVHAKIEEGARQAEKARRAERQQSLRRCREQWEKELRTKKIETARAAAKDGIIPLPEVTPPPKIEERPVSWQRLYAKLRSFLIEDPMPPEQAAALIPPQYRASYVDDARRRQAWLDELVRLLSTSDG